jgi:hypothetical protein
VFVKIASVAVMAILGFGSIAPAYAADGALLQSLVGTWKGKGKLVGAERGTTSCRLTFKAKGENVAYTGRCSTGMGAQTFNGILAYNSATDTFESISKNGTATGQVIDESVVFVVSAETEVGSATSQMSFSQGAITIDFSILDEDAEQTTAHIPFARS